MRQFDRDLIRGRHYGQRSCEPHSKAEHMAAPTSAATSEVLDSPEPSTHEGQMVTFQVADAEQLPFADANFDAVVSTFGIMFTPNQEKATGEMLRVCRPGGMIGMA